MGAIDLLKGERGLLGLAIIIAATVLAALGSMTVPQWQECVTWIFGIFVVGKSATTVAGLIKGTPPSSSPSEPAPAPTTETK